MYRRVEFLRLTCWIQSRNVIWQQSAERRELIKLPSHQQQQQHSAVSVCACVCVCVSVSAVRSREKTSPVHTGSVFCSLNLWVGAPRWKAWKVWSSSSQDEWEDQRAEPSGWAQVRSWCFLDSCKKFLLLYCCQMNVRLLNVVMHILFQVGGGCNLHFIAPCYPQQGGIMQYI